MSTAFSRMGPHRHRQERSALLGSLAAIAAAVGAIAWLRADHRVRALLSDTADLLAQVTLPPDQRRG